MEYSKKAVFNISRVEFYIDQIFSQQWSLFGNKAKLSHKNFLNLLLPFEMFKAFFRLRSYFLQRGLIYNSYQVEENQLDVLIDKGRESLENDFNQPLDFDFETDVNSEEAQEKARMYKQDIFCTLDKLKNHQFNSKQFAKILEEKLPSSDKTLKIISHLPIQK